MVHFKNNYILDIFLLNILKNVYKSLLIGNIGTGTIKFMLEALSTTSGRSSVVYKGKTETLDLQFFLLFVSFFLFLRILRSLTVISIGDLFIIKKICNLRYNVQYSFSYALARIMDLILQQKMYLYDLYFCT